MIFLKVQRKLQSRTMNLLTANIFLIDDIVASYEELHELLKTI